MDSQSAFAFRLTAPGGTVMAISKPFDTKTDAVAGIAAVREYAGMGLNPQPFLSGSREGVSRTPLSPSFTQRGSGALRGRRRSSRGGFRTMLRYDSEVSAFGRIRSREATPSVAHLVPCTWEHDSVLSSRRDLQLRKCRMDQKHSYDPADGFPRIMPSLR